MRESVGRLRRGGGALACVAAPVVAFALAVGTAAAVGAEPIVVVDPGYPGPTSTTTPEPTGADQDAGRVRAGETVVVEACGFRASSPESEVQVNLQGEPVAGADLEPEPPRTVAVSWNDVDTGTAEVDEAGCVHVEVSVNERDDVPPCPAVDVNDQDRAGRRGRNTLVLRGEGANGAPRTVTTTLSISCSNASGNGGGGADGSSTEAGALGTATSEDEAIANGGPGVRATNASSESSLRSRLASSSPMRWAAVNVAVLAVAVVLLAAEWRRRVRRAVLPGSSSS